jgi:hypothetical protein
LSVGFHFPASHDEEVFFQWKLFGWLFSTEEKELPRVSRTEEVHASGLIGPENVWKEETPFHGWLYPPCIACGRVFALGTSFQIRGVEKAVA